jgi:hypothetical protein
VVAVQGGNDVGVADQVQGELLAGSGVQPLQLSGGLGGEAFGVADHDDAFLRGQGVNERQVPVTSTHRANDVAGRRGAVHDLAGGRALVPGLVVDSEPV